MPVYQCLAPADLIEPPARKRIAEEFTRIHTAVTGAPAAFVNVVFIDTSEDRTFTAGEPVRRTIITGFIRAGRDEPTRARLLHQLSEAWSQVTGQKIPELVLGLIDVDPTSAMEAGLILPAPGREAEWTERHASTLNSLRQDEKPSAGRN